MCLEQIGTQALEGMFERDIVTRRHVRDSFHRGTSPRPTILTVSQGLVILAQNYNSINYSSTTVHV
jgi:hypothetical protein